MRFCIVIVLFIATSVHGASKADPLACVDQYNTDATELSKHVSPEISEHVLKPAKILTNSKSCILSGDIECTGDAVFVDAYSDTVKAEQLSTGKLHELFSQIETINFQALKEIQATQKGSSQQLISAICTMCSGKSKLIQAYLAQSPNTPST